MLPFFQETDSLRMAEQFVPASDGVLLYTRTTLPKYAEKCPTILIRTPYEAAHNGTPHAPDAPEYKEFLAHGYAVIVQHCRGTGDSDGICIPYQNERADGLSLLEWVRQQNFYNGELFLYGGSYLSTVHLSYLADRPYDIKGAVLNIQTDRMYFRNYRYGCCYDFCNIGWWLSMMRRQYPNAVRENPPLRPYRDLFPRILGEELPYYTEHLKNDRYNEFWKGDSRTFAAESIHFPVLFTEGWYDFYIEGMFSMWNRLPEETRARSVFWLGPWGHAVPTTPNEDPRFPGVSFPPDYAAAWFDSIRTQTPYPYAKLGTVNYFAPGDSGHRVRDFAAPASLQRLYLSADSSLLADAPLAGTRTFCSDPEHPPVDYPAKAFAPAPAPNSQESLCSFVGQPFPEAKHFFGTVRLHAAVRSNCDDTAFYFRLFLTDPDGNSFYLTDTIAALRFLHPDYHANETAVLELETPPIAFAVPAGYTVRLDVASCGNAYVPHANVAGHWAEVTETRIAQNTVLCAESFLELPQIPEPPYFSRKEML